MISQAEVRQLLHYNPDTGVFTWRPEQMFGLSGNTRYAGTEAGTVWVKRANTRVRYRNIQLRGEKFRAHRLAMFYMTGEWPPAEVDHVDGDGLNACSEPGK